MKFSLYKTTLLSLKFMIIYVLFSNPLLAEIHIIEFGNSLGDNYVPNELTVTVGDTIEWQGSFQFHPLSSTSVPEGAVDFQQSTGTSFQYVITVPGVYNYRCDFHFLIDMVGTFTANDPEPEPQPETSYTACLLGENEVPPNESLGQGGGMFILNGTEDSLWYWVRVCDLTGPITASHFHNGAAGVAGGVVRAITFEDGFSSGVWTSSDDQPLTAELVQAIKDGNIYVNVHTEMYPGGEIRGQLLTEDITLFANLTGDQEVPPAETDASGAGTFVLHGDGKSLDYDVSYENLSSDFSAAHFHRQAAGVAGPVVKAISFTGNTATGTWTSEDAQALTPELVADLLGCWIYANIHTTNYPGGEIRGQVLKKLPEPEPQPETSYTACLLGENEVPPNESLGQGGGMFILNGTEDSLWYWVRVCDLTGPITASHFHNGAAGVAGGVVRAITFEDGFSSGVWTSSDDQPLTAELVQAIKDGNIYVNVHTEMYPGGEIRGQLLTEDITLFANLTGDQEVPPAETNASGAGTFVLHGDGKSLDYDVSYENLSSDFSAAHFHRQAAGVAGPVVKAISFTGNTATGTWTSEDAQALTPELVADLLGCWIYVNVHTTNYPGGEIRGQVLKKIIAEPEFPYMTFWAINDAADGRLYYYTLAEGYDFSNIEGDITGVNSKDIEDLAIDENGWFYFINNVGTSQLYKINPSQFDKDPNTPVSAEYVGDTELPAGAQPEEIASLHFIDGTLYGIGKETKKLYSISTSDGSVTEVGELNVDEFRTDGIVKGADGNVYLLKTIIEGPSELWKFDDFPGSDISFVTVVTSSHKLESIAAHPNGNLYVADQTNLFEINLDETTIGILSNYTVDIEGMEFNYKAEEDKPPVPTREFEIIGTFTDVQKPGERPTAYKLEQNYPNPFNPGTIIQYSIPEAVHVKLIVYNTLGEIVSTLVNEIRNAGVYEARFNASALPSGIYIYKLEAGSYVLTNKMILMK